MRQLWLLLAIAVFIPRSARAEISLPPLKLDLRLLSRLKAVQDDAYWLTNAVPGGTCAGAKVRNLLASLASAADARHGASDPLGTLMSRKIIWNDYWQQNAVPGKLCNGEYVGNLIHAAAEVLGAMDLVRRYRVPPGLLRQPYASAFTPHGADASDRLFNTVLGTQTFSPAYRFTTKPRLVETAEAIRDLGSNVIKFELSSRYGKGNGNANATMRDVHSLTELARDEPAHRQVLDMPFSHFVLWAHTFSVGESRWRSGFTKSDQDAEYREIYDLTRYLLIAYNGTGKTFYLGHWEGDGLLRGTIAPENDAKVTPTAVQGMIDWLNTRQRAVDDAKRDTEYSGVQVWHYTEVNHVKLAMQGRPALVNEVLPKTNVDLVSYSSYDTQADPEMLKRALSFIESKLPRKSGFTGRRVFIGEYGFPTASYSPTEQDRMSREVMKAGLEWGCPLILYWEVYNNEVEADGKQRGFWLIDDKGIKQPVYYTHRDYFAWANRYLTEAAARTGKLPSNDSFRRAALTHLTAEKPQR